MKNPPEQGALNVNGRLGGQDEVQSAILISFRKLPIKAGQEDWLHAAIPSIAQIVTTPETQNFSDVGRTRTQSELRSILRRRVMTSPDWTKIHQTTIEVLAAHGYHRGAGNELLRASAKAALLTNLRDLPIKPQGGRPPDWKARALGSLAAVYFSLLTGKEPGLVFDPIRLDAQPEGPFYNLVVDLVTALALDVSAEHVAREAAKRFKDGRSHKIGEGLLY